LLPGLLGFSCGDSGSSVSGWNYGLLPTPGLPRHQSAAAIAVPGGFVNAVGGNLLIPRVDLSIDTRLGTHEVGAVYNSQTRAWLWSFDIRYDGWQFLDPTGAVHAANGVGDGEPFPGTAWVRLGDREVQTAGGLVHEFAADGRLAAVRWASRTYPRLEYVTETAGGAPRLARVRQCRSSTACADVYTVDYDAHGFVASITDRAGRRAEFLHDAGGRLRRARDPLDVEKGWPGRIYEGGTELLAVTNSEGERIEYEIALVTRRVMSVRQVGPPDRVHRFEYGCDLPLGALTAPDVWTHHVDPTGQRTVYRYDRWRRLRIVELPGGDEIHRGWSGYELARLVHPDGSDVRFEYAAADEVIRHDAGGNRTHIRFCLSRCENRADPFRRPVVEIADDVGPVEARNYSQGRLVWVENGAGERTSLAYDSENMLARVTAPDGTELELSDYGEHGHPETVRLGGETEHRTYDAVGNPVSRTGFATRDFRPGGEVSRRFDADRNPAEIELADAPLAGAPATARIELAWRSDHRPLRIARPGGGDHEFDYDAHGNLIEARERVDGAWRATHVEVDALGRAVAVEMPNGMRRETRYDANGNVDRVRSLHDGALEHEAYLWWAGGRLRAIFDAEHTGPEVHHWDGAGRLASIAFPGGESLELGYDLRGRPVSQTYRLAGGSVLRAIGWDFDLADRPTRVRDGGTVALEQVWEQGRLAETRHASGLVRAYSYQEGSGRLSAILATHPARGLVEATAIEVTPAEQGALDQMVETTSAGTAAATSVESVWLAGGGSGRRVLGFGDPVEDLAYDGLGNLTWSAGGARRHVYNAEGNRLVRIEDVTTGAAVASFESDAAGYVTSRNGVAIAWTAHGQPAAVGADAFEWDALGRPLRRVVAGVERRLAFGGRVEVDAAGLPARLDLGELVLELAAGERRYRHLDYRGNVKLVTDDTGDAVAHYAYAPYGGFTRVGASDDAASFAGGRAVSGLILLGSRLLDPEAGRFLAPDPLLQPVNQFSYTQGDPIGWWDPGGLEATPGPAAYDPALMKIVVGSALAILGVAAISVAPTPITFALSSSLMGLGVSWISNGVLQAIEVYREQNRPRPGGSSGLETPGAPPSPGGPAPQPPDVATPGTITRILSNPPPQDGCQACDAVPNPVTPTAPAAGGGFGGIVFGGWGLGW
jgi:RHS repeat-associated protein